MSNKNLKTKISNLVKEEVERVRYGKTLSEGMRYHLDNKIGFYNNIFRPGSKQFFALFKEMKELWKEGKIVLTEAEQELANSNIGELAVYEGKTVPLDVPFIEEHLSEAEHNGKEVELGKPKRGGSKKFYVYVKCGDKVKKISFGSPNMPLRVSEPERRKSFVARHNCKEKNDRCTAGYWSCRIGRYPHLTGAKDAYTWW